MRLRLAEPPPMADCWRCRVADAAASWTSTPGKRESRPVVAVVRTSAASRSAPRRPDRRRAAPPRGQGIQEPRRRRGGAVRGYGAFWGARVAPSRRTRRRGRPRSPRAAARLRRARAWPGPAAVRTTCERGETWTPTCAATLRRHAPRPRAVVAVAVAVVVGLVVGALGRVPRAVGESPRDAPTPPRRARRGVVSRPRQQHAADADADARLAEP